MEQFLPLAILAGVALSFGGWLGWQLRGHSEAQVRQVVEDVKTGEVVKAVNDATKQ